MGYLLVLQLRVEVGGDLGEVRDELFGGQGCHGSAAEFVRVVLVELLLKLLIKHVPKQVDVRELLPVVHEKVIGFELECVRFLFLFPLV